MPNFAVPQCGGQTPASLNIIALYPNDGNYLLFDAESPVAPQASVAFERGPSAGGDQGATFEINFSAVPVGTVQILGSNKPNLEVFTYADWQVLFSSVNQKTDAYTDVGRFRCYCAYVPVLTAGPTLTITVKR